MRTRAMLLTLCCFFLLTFASAQGKSKAPAKAAGAPDKAILQKVMDAWVTMDISQPAKYYDQAPDDVFYDIAPLKYNGWSEYAKGVTALFGTLQSAKATVNDDAVMHHAGNLAWATATVHFEMTPKSGSPNIMDCRWTSIWEHKGGKWLIVHDHFSAPLAEPK